MPSTMSDVFEQSSRLRLQIAMEFPESIVIPLQRRVFNEDIGMQKLKQLVLEQYSSVLYTVSQKYYGLAAVAALLKYIELMRNIIFPTNALKVEFQLSEKTVMIDRPTAQHLELIHNNLSANSAQSLFGVVNDCRTPGGARCLRTNILQPPCDIELITRRLDCIQELRNNPVMLYDIMNVLSQLPQDLEHVIATLIHIPKVDSNRTMEQRINYIIFLKQTLTVLPAFRQVLENCHHDYFHSTRQVSLHPVSTACTASACDSKEIRIPTHQPMETREFLQSRKHSHGTGSRREVRLVAFASSGHSIVHFFFKILFGTTVCQQVAFEDFCNPAFESILERINTVINEDARVTKGATAMRTQRSFAVNSNLNPLLDVARKAMCEIQDDTTKYVVDLAREYKLNLRLLENNSRGFYVQFMIPGRVWELPPLPDICIHVTKKKNIVTFTTEPLLLAEQRINKILEEIHNISSIIVSELVTEIRQTIGCLYKVSDAISELDILYALTSYSISVGRVVRPEFSSTLMAISMGRHPVLDSISSVSPVPNDLFMSVDTNVSLITGPNMSGKTTLLKQIAALQILAQIGSFVPADGATFRLVSRIFSRIGNGDNIETGSSSFELEMTEMNYILSNINDNSLVIIDELGRSTSIEEGTAFSWAMIESLMKYKSFIFFATHYLFITKLESLYLNVLNYKLDTVESFEPEDSVAEGSGDAALEANHPILPNANVCRHISSARLEYIHVLKRGVTDIEYYGLKLAKNSSYPSAVVQRAMVVAKEIMESRTNSLTSNNNGERSIVSNNNVEITLASNNNDESSLASNNNGEYSLASNNNVASETVPVVGQGFAKRPRYLLASHLYMLTKSGLIGRLSRIEIVNYLYNLQDEFVLTFYK